MVVFIAGEVMAEANLMAGKSGSFLISFNVSFNMYLLDSDRKCRRKS